MHSEAHAGFGAVLERSGIDRMKPWRVLDIGGQQINGSVHDWLPNSTFTVLDLHPGPGVDIVADARSWQPTEKYDIVISTECLEHVQDWPKVVETAFIALDLTHGPGLFVMTAASTNRPTHNQHGGQRLDPGEYYQNVPPDALRTTLRRLFDTMDLVYQPVPGDVYVAAQAIPMLDVTVIIPTFPKRSGMLAEAQHSVAEQDMRAVRTIVEVDTEGEGPAVIRNRALERVETNWVAFLDDDDLLLPQHLLRLAQEQLRTGADVVWPWFRVLGGMDPFPQHFGRQWDATDPHLFPITTLVRAEALQVVGGFPVAGREVPDPNDPRRTVSGEDWHLWLALNEMGCTFHHVPERTWTWRHHGGNTSGLPSRAR